MEQNWKRLPRGWGQRGLEELGQGWIMGSHRRCSFRWVFLSFRLLPTLYLLFYFVATTLTELTNEMRNCHLRANLRVGGGFWCGEAIPSYVASWATMKERWGSKFPTAALQWLEKILHILCYATLTETITRKVKKWKREIQSREVRALSTKSNKIDAISSPPFLPLPHPPIHLDFLTLDFLGKGWEVAYLEPRRRGWKKRIFKDRKKGSEGSKKRCK